MTLFSLISRPPGQSGTSPGFSIVMPTGVDFAASFQWRGCCALQDVRAANVKALSDSLVLTCHRDDFQTHLGRLTDIRRLWRFEALRKVTHTLTLTPMFTLALTLTRHMS